MVKRKHGQIQKELEHTSRLGQSLMRGAAQARDFMEGKEVGGRVSIVKLPDAYDFKAIRKNNDLTQVKVAELLGLSVGAIRDYEQGRKKPGGAARMLFAMIALEPEAVRRTADATGLLVNRADDVVDRG